MLRSGGTAGRLIAVAGIGVMGGLGPAAPAWAEPTPTGSVETEPVPTTPTTAAIPADTPAPAVPARDVPAVREAVLGATRSFTLLFVLAALVAAFLAATGRLERNDPKLAAAPLDENHVEFP